MWKKNLSESRQGFFTDTPEPWKKVRQEKHANMRRSQYADNCMYNSSQLDILLRLNPNSWTMETTQRTELYDIVVIPSHVLDNIASLTVPTTYYDLHV